MKIKFNSDENLPLKETLDFVICSYLLDLLFNDDNKYYPQVFLDGCL